MEFLHTDEKNDEIRNFFEKDRKMLKVNNHLPKIILPKNKLKMFRDWWNSDIRHESSVPHAFDEGYLLIENDGISETTQVGYAPLIKDLAKRYHTTYRQVENEFTKFINAMRKFTLHFKFIKENSINIDCYDGDNGLISHVYVEIGNGDSDVDLELPEDSEVRFGNTDEILNFYNTKNLIYLITSLWYMATTATNTRYIYEEARPAVVSRHKGVVQVSDTKYIRTPVYDFSKIKTVKVERLITRKKGWTYSHSFQVHGHYRHYKNGNTIFIESYIKGKGKPFKAQSIVLEPEKIKED